MPVSISPLLTGSADARLNQQQFNESGQVSGPEPRCAEPERFVQAQPGVGGLRGSPAPGGADKTRQWGGGAAALGVGRGGTPTSLDSLENNRNTFCGRYTVNGPADTEAGERWRYSSLKCRCWDCGRCGPKKLRRFKAAIIHTAEVNQDLRRFLTLTLAHPEIGVGELTYWIRYLRNCWNKFRVYLRRKYGTSVSFICVLELRSKSGGVHPHLHLLVDRFIPQHWISEAWQAVGGGKIVLIKWVDAHRVAGYLSKYVTKEMTCSDFPPYVRRFTTSRDIRLFERREKGEWEVIRGSVGSIYFRCRDTAENATYDVENGEVESFDLIAPMGWEVVNASP